MFLLGNYQVSYKTIILYCEALGNQSCRLLYLPYFLPQKATSKSCASSFRDDSFLSVTAFLDTSVLKIHASGWALFPLIFQMYLSGYTSTSAIYSAQKA